MREAEKKNGKLLFGGEQKDINFQHIVACKQSIRIKNALYHTSPYISLGFIF